MSWFMGIDVGSETSKGIIIGESVSPIYRVLPSEVNYKTAVEKLRGELLAETDLSERDVAYTISTGHGADSVYFADEQVPDVRCCARGISNVFPSVRTVIDIGSQTSRVIQLSEEGQMMNFTMSERCAAGSGIFLQILADVLGIDIKDIGQLSLKSNNPVTFTTGCAVFAETEAISRIAEGASKEDILAGVHRALADKIYALVNRVGLKEPYAISGGGGLDIGLLRSVEEKLGLILLVPDQPQGITALGAAVIAKGKSEANRASAA